MKLIFLDIDGVMNSSLGKESYLIEAYDVDDFDNLRKIDNKLLLPSDNLKLKALWIELIYAKKEKYDSLGNMEYRYMNFFRE